MVLCLRVHTTVTKTPASIPALRNRSSSSRLLGIVQSGRPSNNRWATPKSIPMFMSVGVTLRLIPFKCHMISSY